MQASDSIKAYIKHIEGFKNHAYLDPPGNTKGLHSIGYGHQIQPNEPQLLTKIITQAEADLMFDADFRMYEAAVNRNLTRPVTQDQFDALCDFAYNEGTGAVAKPIYTWNTTGRVTDTVARIKLYDESGGKINPDLIARRGHEANLFASLITAASLPGAMDVKKN